MSLNVNDGLSGGGTSTTVENVEQQKGFQSKDIKEEELEDEDYLCTTPVWGRYYCHFNSHSKPYYKAEI